MNFKQKLRLFSDIHFCMDIMMGMVREDFLIASFENTWSPWRVKKLKHQPKELVNQNGDRNEWKWRGIFLIIFNIPVLPVDTTKDQLFITDVSWKNEHRVVPKLMIIVLKWDKRNNQRKLISYFTNYWTRIIGWLTVMPKVLEWYRKPEKWLKTELSINNRWRIEQKVIIWETSKTNE